MNQILVMANGECKFNMPLKLRKSFQINDDEDKLQTQNLGYASMPEQFKELQLEPGKYFWGYANVEKVDMQGDLFPIETLEELAPGLTSAPYNKIFLNHDYSDIASGLIVATATDSKGLMILAKLNEDHQRSYEIWQSILNGSLDGLSMGGSFLEVESYYDEPNDMTITVAKKATATEVSLTSIPINGSSMMMGAFQKARKILKERDPMSFMKGKEIKKGGPGSGPKKGTGQGNHSEEIEGKVQELHKKWGSEVNQIMTDFAANKIDIGQKQKLMKESMGRYEDAENKLKIKKSADGENFKYNKSQDKTMVKKEDLNDSQKKAYDKAVADGKSEDEALKMVKKEQVDEADKNVNQDLVGKKKPIKKSVGDEEAEKEEADEGDADEDPKEKKAEDEVIPEKAVDEKAEDEDTPEEEDKTDYKKAFEDEKAKNEKLESKLAEFKKSLPSESEKAIRKSKKTEQEPATPVPAEKTQAKSGTPFLDYLRN